MNYLRMSLSKPALVLYKDAARLIQNAERIVFASHINPDGDTLGSVCALAHLAKQAGKAVQLFCRDAVPEEYSFLVGSAEYRAEVGELTAADLLVVLDCSEPWRLGEEAEQLLKVAPHGLNIDHHAGGTPLGEVNLIDTEAAAAGVLVHELLVELRWQIDLPAAEALYTAIDTDTGSFRYPNTDARCLRVVAELVEGGLRPNKVAERLYESNRAEKFRLLGKALSTLELLHGGRLALLIVTEEMYAETGANVEDTAAIVDYARGISGVEVGAFLRQDGADKVKLSLRSKDGVAVNDIARQIGGGGHRCAAGATFTGTIAEARDWIVEAMRCVASQNRTSSGKP